MPATRVPLGPDRALLRVPLGACRTSDRLCRRSDRSRGSLVRQQPILLFGGRVHGLRERLAFHSICILERGRSSHFAERTREDEARQSLFPPARRITRYLILTAVVKRKLEMPEIGSGWCMNHSTRPAQFLCILVGFLSMRPSEGTVVPPAKRHGGHRRNVLKLILNFLRKRARVPWSPGTIQFSRGIDHAIPEVIATEVATQTNRHTE